MKSADPAFDSGRFGVHLARARAERSLSQAELAPMCGLSQQQLSRLESGAGRPTLGQVIKVGRALDIPIQRLVTGGDRPGVGPEGLAIELRRLGILDLWVRVAEVPGAFRRPEDVINLALAGGNPDPRILEALPAALAWSDLDPDLLAGHAAAAGTTRRLAWLADITLAIARRAGFPGGCRSAGPLEKFLAAADTPARSEEWDGLGYPSSGLPPSPIWRRWRISYDAGLPQFQTRAESLHGLRKAREQATTLRGRMIVGVEEAPDAS